MQLNQYLKKIKKQEPASLWKVESAYFYSEQNKLIKLQAKTKIYKRMN